MPTKVIGDGLGIMATYGKENFATMVIFVLMFILVAYVIRSADSRETRLSNLCLTQIKVFSENQLAHTTNMQAIHTSVQQLLTASQQAVMMGQTRYESYMTANSHQRSEHTSMNEKLATLNEETNVITRQVVEINTRLDEFECKAK